MQDEAPGIEDSLFEGTDWLEHYLLHRDEWSPPLTAEEYKAIARELFDAQRRDPDEADTSGFTRRVDRPELDRRVGDVVRYRPATNEYAVKTNNGKFKTLFRPDKGEDYYLDDVASYGHGTDMELRSRLADETVIPPPLPADETM
jgi:hypothetical protein